MFMRKNIETILNHFFGGFPKDQDTCSTDGQTIYSYSEPIVKRQGNEILVLDKYPTRTTQGQINACKLYLKDEPGYRVVPSFPREIVICDPAWIFGEVKFK